jgi:hypothetical protein
MVLVLCLLNSELCLLNSSAWAGGGAGTTGAQFLQVGVGAREVAMGGAGVAISNDAHALYWNPAGAAKITDIRLDATYNNLYQDTNQGFVAVAKPWRGGVWSAGVDYLQVSGVEERLTDTASPNYTFTSKDSALMVSYARPNVISGLALGANLKYIQSFIDTANANAAAVDFGALYEAPSVPLSVGASVANLGSGLKYVNATEPLPLVVRLGAGYRLLDRKLLAAVGYDAWIRDNRSYGDLGLEYKPVNWVAVRTGYQLGHGQDQLGSSLVGFSAGVGFEFKSLTFDYAYVPFGDLGTTQRHSVGFRFGESSDNSSAVIKTP